MFIFAHSRVHIKSKEYHYIFECDPDYVVNGATTIAGRIQILRSLKKIHTNLIYPVTLGKLVSK